MKRQIRITKKDIRIFSLIVILPFVLMYFLEHFGSFSSTHLGYNSPPYVDPLLGVSHPESIINARLHDRTFTTLLGSEIKDNLFNEKLYAYRTNEETGGVTIEPYYSTKVGYYLRGVKEDIVVPIVLVLIGIVFFKLSKVFVIKIDK